MYESQRVYHANSIPEQARMVEVVILEVLSAEKSTVQNWRSESVQKIAKMPKMCNIQRREGGVWYVCVRATVRKSDGCGCESVLYEYFTKVFVGGHSQMTSVKFSGLFTPIIVATTSLTPIWPASSPSILSSFVNGSLCLTIYLWYVHGMLKIFRKFSMLHCCLRVWDDLEVGAGLLFFSTKVLTLSCNAL